LFPWLACQPLTHIALGGHPPLQELHSLHKLELVQLESWLDAQVQAGKALPLKDGEAYKRRREALCSTEV